MHITADLEAYKEKEALYYEARNKEGRIINDSILIELPYVSAIHPYKKEWDIRASHLERFSAYLKKHFKKPLNILDVGCGNGWMTNRLNQLGYNITGVDLNMEELLQAERVFGSSPSLRWVYADVLNDTIPGDGFDIIVFGASCQYFPDIAQLTNRLSGMLTSNGEIHLLDSVFYRPAEVDPAKQRSVAYYDGLGIPAMSQYYFHHSIAGLKASGYKKLFPGFFDAPSTLQWWHYKQ